MVIGSLKNTKRLEALNPYFKKVFEYLKSHDLTTLPLGRIEIDGRNAWISVCEVRGKEKNVARIESHDQYIDIQMPLSGGETYGWQARELLREEEERGYDPEKDITFYKDAAALFVTLSAGEFVIFFPEDGHAPCIGEGSIKKMVIKVKA